MRLFACPLLLLFLSTSAIHAQRITGKVSSGPNAPLPGITVRLAATGLSTQTNDRGEFVLDGVAPGSYQVRFSGVGYQSVSRDVVMEKSPIVLNVALAEVAEQLQTIEVTGRKETDYKNDLTFIGSKSATRLKDVPQSISYVTKELALDQAAFRVNDVVKNMSGVNQYSLYNDLTIRGHRVSGQDNYGNLVNGMRAFTSFWKQQLIPHMERVEVIKGPASALFGNASPGGTINRVTKKPLDERRMSVSSTVGSFNTFRTTADFTGPMNEEKTLLYRLNLGYENSGSFRDLQYDKNLIIAPSFSFLPTAKTRLNFDMVYQNGNGRLDRGQAVFGNGNLYSVPINRSLSMTNDYLKEDSYNVTVSLAHQFSRHLTFNSAYMRSSYAEDLLEHRTANTYTSLADGSRSNTLVEMQAFIRKRTWNNDNFNNYFNLNFGGGKVRNQTLIGYDYAQQALQPGGSQLTARGYLNAARNGSINSFNPARASLYALDARGNPIPNVASVDLSASNPYALRDMSKYIYTTVNYESAFLVTQGAYIQNQLTVGPLQVLLGLRQDSFTDKLNYGTADESKVTQNALIPRVGLVYTVTKNVNAYATYVKGYQPQDANRINNPNAGGPFDPLTSALVEGGIKSDWLDGRLNATMAVYRLRQRGTLYPSGDTQNPDLLVQIGEEMAQGVELDLIGQIADNWSLIVNYSFNDATITESTNEAEVGRQKPNAPRHQGNLWTKYGFSRGPLSGLGVGFGTNFVAERLGSIVPAGQDSKLFPGYQLFNAAVYYRVNRMQVQLNINNLTNKTHWVGGYDYLRAFPGAPRNLLATVSYTF